MATIRDVARKSGYSVATVSRVLNHKPYVKPAVKAAIEAVIKELDYVPNDVARDLSRGSTRTIGVVLPRFSHPYFTDLTVGIMDAAFANGYNVVLLPSHYDAQVEQDALEQLRRKAYDGLIFTSHQLSLAAMVPYLAFGPVVVCQDPGQVALPAAYTDRGRSYDDALHWIRRRGFHRVGVMLPRGTAVSATAQAIVAAYTRVFGAAPDPALCWVDSMTYADGVAAGAFFAQAKADFVFANGDDIAAGVRQHYLDHNLPVPGLMGQENQLSGQLLGLPSIDHHFKRVGRAALELAIGKRDQSVVVPADFIVR
ncbi:LacI family DNA-binding transcriptional regulator [Lacticaseibacillus parakribbianus]|uniref:LacI family DNA-binding transcriptional regulator n=1 Tax=Lacticaseibacillus parakribbianus TaxID=2970927 RepID=UPI0021CB1B12|nr:LacI family DNA-binding transcriptional regulator [Lacticaseibacillus parakribbianus]